MKKVASKIEIRGIKMQQVFMKKGSVYFISSVWKQKLPNTIRTAPIKIFERLKIV